MVCCYRRLTTPSSQSTTISGTVGSIFDSSVWDKIIKQYQLEPITLPISGSDQGTVTITPRHVASLVTRTYTFSLDYTGESGGSPCSNSFPLTLIVLVDWSAEASIAQPYVDLKANV